MSVTTILLFLIILLVLVTVHEFGHFIAAKLVKMRVDEFAFGFPPRIWSIKRGETTYAINALPLGGYVSIWGENGSEEDQAKNGAKHHPRAFGNRPWWAQLLVLVAGVTMNMILAVVIFIAISYGEVQMSANDPQYGSRIHNSALTVVDASPLSPALKAGIKPGSILVKATTPSGAVADLSSPEAFIAYVTTHTNEPFTITYKNTNGVIANTTVATVYGIVADKKALGISIERVGTVKTSFSEALSIGWQRTVDMTSMTLDGLTGIFTSLVGGKSVLASLSGPVGIARIVGQTSEYGYRAVLRLVAVLSINLAIFNILPLPALDGGRMVVVIIETIVRRKIPHKYYAWANTLGFSLLMLLLVVVTIKDLHS
jgi:regulator of sigma E protease